MERSTRAIFLFVSLSLGFSVCYWAMFSLWPKGSLPYPVEFFFSQVFRNFGPAISAFIAAYYKDRGAGVRTLLSRMGRWKVNPWLYLLGCLWSVFAVASGVLAAHFFQNVPLNPAAAFAPRLIFVFLMMALFDGPLGEEPGWRGFLLPELLRKMHPVLAGCIVGIIWWTWHIPLYTADGRSIPWIAYLIQTIPLSLIFTWFFLRTRYSVFFTIFLHDWANFPIYLKRQFFPQLQNIMVDKYVYVGVVILFGLLAAILMSKQQFKEEKVKALL
jgi:membrane protease YdiL (CAAX protease family)